MSTVGDRMKRARKAKGWSQQKLADLMDVERSTVSSWERNIHEPRTGMIPLLANLLEIPSSHLSAFGLSNVQPVRMDLHDNDNKGRALPIMPWKDLPLLKSGRTPRDIAHSYYPVADQEDYEEGDYRLEIVDDSMAPTISTGDRVRVRLNWTPWDGALVVAIISEDDEPVLRRYQKRRGNAYDLVAEDPEFPTITVNQNNPASIVGVVMRIITVIKPPQDC